MCAQVVNVPGQYRPSLAAAADKAWGFLYESVVGLGWAPLARLCESIVVTQCHKLTLGQLRIVTSSQVYDFGGVGDANLKAELRIIRDSFWIRTCTMPGSLGFGEAFMFGDVECDDLVALCKIFIKNNEHTSGMRTRASDALQAATQSLSHSRFLGTLANSRGNISMHYDLSNEMFAVFLGKDMTYSSAIFDDIDGDLRVSHTTSEQTAKDPRENSHIDELHEAQMRKYKFVMQRADIKPHHRVLEIGSGWGSCAILLAQTHGCRVDTLTLSSEQQALAQQRIASLGLSDLITVHLLDYRALPKEWEHQFDRMISIEMYEHVGEDFHESYWKMVDWALKERHAGGCVVSITMPEGRSLSYRNSPDFLRKYVSLGLCEDGFVTSDLTNISPARVSVFPGGYLPTVTQLLNSITAGSHNSFVIDSASNHGPHYARTLREWRNRFVARWESDIGPSLKKVYPEAMTDKDAREMFRRKFIFYFASCEAAFAERYLTDHIVTFRRDGDTEYTCNVLQ